MNKNPVKLEILGERRAAPLPTWQRTKSDIPGDFCIQLAVCLKAATIRLNAGWIVNRLRPLIAGDDVIRQEGGL
jgi:hypothetical protein